MLEKKTIEEYQSLLSFTEKVKNYLLEDKFFNELKDYRLPQRKSIAELCEENDYVVAFVLFDVLNLHGYLDIVQNKDTKNTHIQFSDYKPRESAIEEFTDYLKDDFDATADMQLTLLKATFKDADKRLKNFVKKFNIKKDTKFKIEEMQFVDSNQNGFDYHDMVIKFDLEEMNNKIETFSQFYTELLKYLIFNWHLSHIGEEIEMPSSLSMLKNLK